MQNENEKIVFQGKMIEIVHETVFSKNKELTLEKGRRAPGVRLIIKTKDGKFLINKEQRLSTGLDYRLPGGKVFDSLREYNEFLSSGEEAGDILQKAKEAAVKEGMEEVGIRPLELELFHISRCGGSFEWDLYYFIVRTYEEVGQSPEEHEKIEVMEVSAEELKELAVSGRMQEDRSVGTLFKYFEQENK